MKVEIVNFIRKAIKRYGISAYYTPKYNMYVLHLDGRAIQNFSENNFYEIPKMERMKMLEPLIKVGLNSNLSNKNHNQIIGPYKTGHKIV